MFDTGLNWFLETNAALQALLNPAGYALSPVRNKRADKTTGIFPVAAISTPALPYIVFFEISATPNNVMEGVNRYQSARYRFTCYGSDFTNAKRVSRALKLQLQGYKGVWYSLADNSAQVEIQGAWLAFEGDNPEPELHNTIFTSVVDFNINFIDMLDT
jgi:hypothetical protein